MEKRAMKLEFTVGTTATETSKTLELVQREHKRDGQEKDDLRGLNDRFSLILGNIDQLKRRNEQLQAELKDQFAQWGILPRDEHALQLLIEQINKRAVQRATDEVHWRTAEQDTSVLNRISSVYGHVQLQYKRKFEQLNGVIDRLQDELRRSDERLRASEEELETIREDLQREVKKFRERSQDWIRLVIDKQTLLDDIQSMRERMNLINALNEEEINEWKRLLDQSKDDSSVFYREELLNAIRDIKRDYTKQAKVFQDELEYQIEGQLRMVESQLQQTNAPSVDETENKRLQVQETKLRSSMEEFEKEKTRLNELNKLLTDKRRLLRDEEAKYHEMQRKIRDRQAQEQMRTERLQQEYEELRRHFEQMAFQLRFSIEDELQIYARLLDELMKKSSTVIQQSTTTLTEEQRRRHSGDASSGIFELSATHESEVHETFDAESIVRSSPSLLD